MVAAGYRSIIAAYSVYAGSIVPIAPGRMRSEWFPRHIASYIPYTELRALRRQEVPMERDPDFDPVLFAKAKSGSDADTGLSQAEQQEASMFQSSPITSLTPERSKELLEIFVPSRLDFYRPAIIEEVKEPERPERESNFGEGAGAELLAARSQAAKPKATGQQAIYGSVSSHDVLVAVRAVMGNSTDEARRVVLHDGDVVFVGLEQGDHERVKHVGEFMVEIKVGGVETGVKRIVRVHAQDAGDVVGSQKSAGVTA